MKDEPAFPIVEDTEFDSGYHMTTVAKGLTVRDWFAAKAMQAMMSSETAMMTIKACAVESGQDGPIQMARTAYGMALAMLIVRQDQK